MSSKRVCQILVPWRARAVPVLLACAGACAASGLLQAADGQPDLTFNPNGAYEIACNYGGNLNDYVQDVAADSNGNLLVVGYLTSETGDYDWGLVRLDAQGGGQRTRLFFDQGGTNNDEANAVALDSTGGVVVAGTVDTASSRDIRICRFFPDTLGLDSSFGSGGCGSVSTGAGT